MCKRSCQAIAGFALAIALAALGGCRQGAEQRSVSLSGAGPREHDVPLLVLQGPGGSTLAFVPVCIDGHGPFSFTLDTGASNSVAGR